MATIYFCLFVALTQLCCTPVIAESLEKNNTFDTELYEQVHPHHLTALKVSYTFMYLSWEPPDVNASQIMSYEVRYAKHDDRLHELNITVPNGTTTCYLRSLTPGTHYAIYVEARYIAGQRPHTISLEKQTLGYGPDNPCHCSPWGSATGKCDPESGQCECRDKYTTGLRCTECHSGYYPHDHLGCEPCHCPESLSNGTCRVENGVVFCNCREGHRGVHCTLCDNGFYMNLRNKGKCASCFCNGNENKSSENICDVDTGECLACINNTAGQHCHQCADGHIGDALKHNCTLLASTFMSHKAVVVIATCLTVIVITIIVIILILLAKSRKLHNKPFNIWSVQLRGDHENVNFSAMVDQHDAHDDDLLNQEDVQFTKQKPELTFGSLRYDKA